MDVLSNIDLLTVGLAVTTLFLIGVAVLFANPYDRVSRYFALFCFVNVLWGITNYISYQLQDPFLILVSLRLILFTAVFQTMSFYMFIWAFGNEKLPRWFIYFGIPLGFATAIPALTPAYFSGISAGTSSIAPQPIVSPAITLFALVSFFFVLMGLYSLIKQLKSSSGARHEQLSIIFTGTALMFALIVSLNFLAPVIFDTTYFVPLGAIFVLPFALLTAYAILRFQLFSVKAVATGVLTFLLVMSIFIEVIFSGNGLLRIWKVVEAGLVLFFGIMLFKGVVREVQQREKIQKLAGELEISNGQLSEFMSLATHEIRNPATVIKGVSAGALEGDLGELTPVVKDAMQKIFIRINDIIHLGNQYLNKSKLELNQLKYEFTSLDLGKLAEDLVREFQPSATQYGITATSVIDKSMDYMVQADSGKIKEVLGNLIDNAIKYTPKGSVTVSVLKGSGTVRVEIADTGVGIPVETIPQLFKKFSRADAQKVNLLGTGLGLYLAKIFIDAHHGKIWVESPGKDKGSTFYIELPITQKEPLTP